MNVQARYVFRSCQRFQSFRRQGGTPRRLRSTDLSSVSAIVGCAKERNGAVRMWGIYDPHIIHLTGPIPSYPLTASSLAISANAENARASLTAMSASIFRLMATPRRSSPPMNAE